ENLKLARDGRIVLLDFGLAKGGFVPGHDPNVSVPGFTREYASLEQIMGQGTDERSDIYSLGATLHHLLDGNKAPDALTRASAALNRQPDPYLPPLSHWVTTGITRKHPMLTRKLGQMICAMMALLPKDRPGNIRDLLSGLQVTEREPGEHDYRVADLGLAKREFTPATGFRATTEKAIEVHEAEVANVPAQEIRPLPALRR